MTDPEALHRIVAEGRKRYSEAKADQFSMGYASVSLSNWVLANLPDVLSALEERAQGAAMSGDELARDETLKALVHYLVSKNLPLWVEYVESTAARLAEAERERAQWADQATANMNRAYKAEHLLYITAHMECNFTGDETDALASHGAIVAELTKRALISAASRSLPPPAGQVDERVRDMVKRLRDYTPTQEFNAATEEWVNTSAAPTKNELEAADLLESLATRLGEAELRCAWAMQWVDWDIANSKEYADTSLATPPVHRGPGQEKGREHSYYR